jgi:AcrR family transcriptional regulator
MGRPRAFDETEVVEAASRLFASRAYDGISIDDLVSHLGVHRNSLYKAFGSKRGLYLAALRWHLHHQVRPLLVRIGEAAEPAEALRAALAGDLGLLQLALVERAAVDPEVADEVTAILREIDKAVDRALGAPARRTPSPLAGALTAAVLGLQLRARTGGIDLNQAGAALIHHIER